MTSELLTGEEDEVYGDSGYIGADKREDALVRNKNGRKNKYKLNRKPSRIKKLSTSGQYAAKKSEHKKSSIRAKVEQVFAVVKQQLGYRRTRYRDLEKQTSKLRQHRTKIGLSVSPSVAARHLPHWGRSRSIAPQIFRQIVQSERRKADALQVSFVQYDGKYASKRTAKHEVRSLCGVALNIMFALANLILADRKFLTA